MITTQVAFSKDFMAAYSQLPKKIQKKVREYTEQLDGINAQYRAALEIVLQALNDLPAIPPRSEVQPESESGYDHEAGRANKLSQQIFASDLSPDHDMSEASQKGRSVISIAMEQARSASRRQLSHPT